MARVLEELIAAELDTLYRGALFLCAGGREAAETLLERTAASASRRRLDRHHADIAFPVERLMIREFLGNPPAADVPPLPLGDPVGLAGFGKLTSNSLYRGAASVPAAPRAAIWLVVIRRWTYDDAADAMDVGGDALREALAYRDTFMAGTLRSSGLSRRRAVE